MSNFHRLLLIVIVLSISSTTVLQAQSAKFGKGVQIMAEDSSFFLQTNFRFQSLFTTSGDLERGADWHPSFNVRRARIKFKGWALNPRLQYAVQLALSNQDLKSKADYNQTEKAPKIILDAVVKWQFHKNVSLWAGQTKLPGNRQRVVSSQKQQFVDRSLVNSLFNLDREMGIQLHGKFRSNGAVIKPIMALSMGDGRNVTQNIGGFNYTGRIEYLPLGDFTGKGDYFESDLKREPTPKLAFGATYNLNIGASRQKQSGAFLIDQEGTFLTNDLRTLLIDAVLKYRGFSLTGEYADKRCVLDQGIAHEDVALLMIDASGKSYYTGSGLNMQMGYLFQNNWEVAGRYTSVTPDWEHSFTGIREYTMAVSRYIAGHNIKIQSDISFIDKVSKSVNTLRYRVQFEFSF